MSTIVKEFMTDLAMLLTRNINSFSSLKYGEGFNDFGYDIYNRRKEDYQERYLMISRFWYLDENDLSSCESDDCDDSDLSDSDNE